MELRFNVKLSKNGILSKRDYKCHLLGASKHGVYTL